MNNRKLNLLAVLLGACFAATAYAVWTHGPNTQRPLRKPERSTLPNITSCLGSLAVQSSFFRKLSPDSESTELVLQLMNNSEKSIVAISIEWTSKADHIGHGLVTNSFGADTPEILAAPHSLYEVTIPVSNIPSDADVQVGSVVYSDNTDDGCTGSLKDLRALKSKREREAQIKNSKEVQK